MSKNLRHELRSAVFHGFREHIDKRAEKAAGKGDALVFSYGQRNGLLDVSENFARFMKEARPEVRSPQAVEKTDIVAFLEQKKAHGCTTATLETYRANLAKLGRLTGCDWRTPQIFGASRSAQRGAGHPMPAEVADALLAYAEKSPSGSAFAFVIGHETGARVTDVKRAFIDEVAGTVRIVGKGGKRYPERPVTPVLRHFLELPAYRAMIAEGRPLLPQARSIEKWLQRTEKRLGFGEQYSFHDLRRLCAQRHYDALRASGVTIEDAVKRTSVWLNHGPNRADLMTKSYIQLH